LNIIDSLIVAIFFNFLTPFIIFEIENLKNPKTASVYKSWFWGYRDKKQFIQALFHVFKVQSKYLTIPLFISRLVWALFLHKIKSNSEITCYFDPGYIAQYAIQNHHNSLLKNYLSFGFNASFRDAKGTTLFEYCFLYDNKEAGKWLLEQPNVFENQVRFLFRI